MIERLTDIARRVLRKKAAHIKSINNTPYHLVRDILIHCPAEQLRTIELNSCPELCLYTDEIWQRLVVRRWTDVQDNITCSWRDYYRILEEKEEKKTEAMRKRIRSAYHQVVEVDDRPRKVQVTEVCRPQRRKGPVTRTRTPIGRAKLVARQSQMMHAEASSRWTQARS